MECGDTRPEGFFESDAEVIYGKVIEFYIPSSFQRKPTKWIPQKHKEEGDTVRHGIEKETIRVLFNHCIRFAWFRR
jgi:hypothetical protein